MSDGPSILKKERAGFSETLVANGQITCRHISEVFNHQFCVRLLKQRKTTYLLTVWWLRRLRDAILSCQNLHVNASIELITRSFTFIWPWIAANCYSMKPTGALISKFILVQNSTCFG